MLRLREWLNQNPMVVVAGCVVFLVLAIVWIGFQLFGGSDTGGSTARYYYDEKAKELVVVPLEEIGVRVAPIEYEGRQLVEAHVYACGDCDDDNPEILFLQRYPDAWKKQIEKSRAEGAYEDEEGEWESLLVRRPDDARWVRRVSPAGQEITASKDCEDFQYCQPGE